MAETPPLAHLIATGGVLSPAFVPSRSQYLLRTPGLCSLTATLAPAATISAECWSATPSANPWQPTALTAVLAGGNAWHLALPAARADDPQVCQLHVCEGLQCQQPQLYTLLLSPMQAAASPPPALVTAAPSAPPLASHAASPASPVVVKATAPPPAARTATPPPPSSVASPPPEPPIAVSPSRVSVRGGSYLYGDGEDDQAEADEEAGAFPALGVLLGCLGAVGAVAIFTRLARSDRMRSRRRLIHISGLGLASGEADEEQYSAI